MVVCSVLYSIVNLTIWWKYFCVYYCKYGTQGGATVHIAVVVVGAPAVVFTLPVSGSGGGGGGGGAAPTTTTPPPTPPSPNTNYQRTAWVNHESSKNYKMILSIMNL